MKKIDLKTKTTRDKISMTVSSNQKNNTDSRYDYLMALNSHWIATQDNTEDFIHSFK